MNKKLIVLAVAGVLAVPAVASAADVEVYGQARLSLAQTSNDNDAAGAGDSQLSITSHNSRLGFKGSEDLGSGLSAVYQVEGEIDLDDNEKTGITSRNSFAGLAGGFGTVILGRHDTPYKIATAKMDPFADTHADYTGTVVDKTHDARADNVLAYISPDMNGFSFVGAYVTDFADDDLDGTDPEDGNPAYSLAGTFATGPLTATLAYQTVDNGGALLTPADATDDDESADATKLGLGYKISDAASVNAIYETTELGDADQDNIYLSGSFAVTDSTKLLAAYGQRGEVGDTDDTGSDFFAIGVTTAMSKTTELYAQYADLSNEDESKYDLDKVKSVTKGGGASALAVGINVKFSSK